MRSDFDLALVERALYKRSLTEFVKAAWHVIEPATPLLWNWHLDAICVHVQALIEDKPGTPQNLLMNVPPGTMKSLVTSVFLPAWVWLRRPSWRACFASGTPSVVTRDSLKCRALIKSEWYQKTFAPEWQISKDQDEKQLFSNTAGGLRQGVSAGGAITGVRADCLLADDPNNASDIHSKAHRTSINENWWDAAWHNRIADPARSKRIIIMQRLHEEDLAGYLLAKEGDQWAHLCLPMEFDKNLSKTTWLGWTDPRRREGELLFPQRFDAAYLESERKTLGSAGYAGQMQQRPAPAAGNRFKREWWRFWAADGQMKQRPTGSCAVPPVRFNPAIDRFDEVVGSWDCSFKDGDENDYVVGLTVYRVGALRYVVARYRNKSGLGATVEAVRQQARDWKPYEVLVEDKANGSAVVELLQSEVDGILAVNPKGGKEARAAVLEPKVEAGQWLLPEGAEWLGEWMDEFASFPLGKHDDQVDAASQLEARLIEDSDVSAARQLLGITHR